LIAETGPKPSLHLRNKGNFGNQDKGGLLPGDGIGHHVQVNLGFTAARHPLQQDRRKALCPGLMDVRQGLLLFRRQFRGMIRQNRFTEGIPIGIAFVHRYKPPCRHATDDRGGIGQDLAELLEGRFAVLGKGVQDGLPLGGNAFTGDVRAHETHPFLPLGPCPAAPQCFFTAYPAALFHGLQQAARHRAIEMRIQLLEPAGAVFETV
jgi:hypothetical protein